MHLLCGQKKLRHLQYDLRIKLKVWFTESVLNGWDNLNTHFLVKPTMNVEVTYWEMVEGGKVDPKTGKTGDGVKVCSTRTYVNTAPAIIMYHIVNVKTCLFCWGPFFNRIKCSQKITQLFSSLQCFLLYSGQIYIFLIDGANWKNILILEMNCVNI